MSVKILIAAVDLEVALNYGQSTGSPQLLRFVTEHIEVKIPFYSSQTM